MRAGAVVLLLAMAGQALAAPTPPPRPRDLSRWDGWISIEPRRWPKGPQGLGARVTPAPQAEDCLDRLASAGVAAQRAPAPDATNAACVVDAPVRVSAIAADGLSVRVSGEPLLACAFASQLGHFVREVAAPLAKGALSAELRAMEVGGGYECRPRNRTPGAKMSAHGRGLALDVAALTLSDGRRLVVGKAEGAGARYVEALRRAACGYFLTVLGPGSDAAHADHLHLDLEPHGASGTARICQ